MFEEKKKKSFPHFFLQKKFGYFKNYVYLCKVIQNKHQNIKIFLYICQKNKEFCYGKG